MKLWWLLIRLAFLRKSATLQSSCQPSFNPVVVFGEVNFHPHLLKILIKCLNSNTTTSKTPYLSSKEPNLLALSPKFSSLTEVHRASFLNPKVIESPSPSTPIKSELFINKSKSPVKTKFQSDSKKVS